MTENIRDSIVGKCVNMDDAVAERIAAGIETHRKTDITVRVVDAASAPLPGVSVEARQMSHAFQFGANAFLLGGYPSEAQNRRWEDAYARLFNQTVVPFYWAEYELAPERYRYGIGSEPRFRRPPVDAVLDWCERTGIVPKGHNLIWHILYPEWLPDDEVEQWAHIERRFRLLAGRYGTRIRSWDVVNEALDRRPAVRMPKGYLHRCYALADHLFPRETRLFVNETTHRSWADFHGDTSGYYLLIDSLLQRGLRVDGIGMQFHLFRLLHELPATQAALLDPAHLLAVLDQYADYGRPIHISEITVPAGGDVADGEAIQAELVAAFYRAWFSHPAVEAITWWNLADGMHWKDEGRFLGGLLRDDLTPKPAYEVLDELINHEWKTQAAVITDADGMARFRGFCGGYELAARGATCRIQAEHGADTFITLTVK